MLGKLYKHEVLRSFRGSWFLFLAISISCAVATLSFILPEYSGWVQIVFTILFIPYPIIIIFSITFCFIMVVYRFYTSMFSAEGYLTFTLPFSNMAHFYSKLIVGVATLITIIAFAILTIEPIARIAGYPEIAPSGWNLTKLGNYSNSIPITVSPVVVMLYIIAGITIAVLMFFTALCAGQMFKNRILGSIGAYFVLYLIAQAIALIIMVIYIFNMGLIDGPTSMDYEPFITSILTTITVIMIIQFAGMLAICHYSISKKLNLE